MNRIVTIIILAASLMGLSLQAQPRFIRSSHLFVPMYPLQAVALQGGGIVYSGSLGLERVSATGDPLWGYYYSDTADNSFCSLQSTVFEFNQSIIFCAANIFYYPGISTPLVELQLTSFSPTGTVLHQQSYQLPSKPYALQIKRVSDSSCLLVATISKEMPVVMEFDTSMRILRSSVLHSNTAAVTTMSPYLYSITNDTLSFISSVPRSPTTAERIMLLYKLYHDSVFYYRYYQFDEGFMYPESGLTIGSNHYVSGTKVNRDFRGSGFSILKIEGNSAISSAESMNIIPDNCIHSMSYGPEGSVAIAAFECNDTVLTSIFEFDTTLALRSVVKLRNIEDSPLEAIVAGRQDGPLYVVGANTKTIDQATFLQVLGPSLTGCNLIPTLSPLTTETFKVVGGYDHLLSVAPYSIAPMPRSFMKRTANSTFDVATLCGSIDGVHPLLPPSVVSVYPNPVTGNIHLRIPPLNGDYLVRLRDLTGVTILQSFYYLNGSETLNIPTTGYSSGMYVVELADANSFATLWRGKIIIE